MATIYATEFVGAKDGTQSPPLKLDGRLVGAKERRVRATKPQTLLNPGDQMFIGTLPQGSSARGFAANFDTAFGGATVNIGTLANPTKYVNGKAPTVTDVPSGIGPRAAVAVAAPLTVDEDLYMTVVGAAIPAAVIGCIETTYTIST